MRVLVTGGAGFIGSHVVDALIAAGNEVTILDNLSTGKESNLNPQAQFYRLDLNDPVAEKIFARHRPEALVHCAAQIDVRKSVADPVFDATVNVIGALRILEAARPHGLQRVVFASSGGVMYGEVPAASAPESAPAAPISPYGASKLAVEHYLRGYDALHAITSASLRFGNVYGPRQDPHGEAGVVAIFLNALLAGRAPTIFGDGEQIRDYVYVADVVGAVLKALAAAGTFVVNIGTGGGTSVNRLYAVLKSLTGFAGEALHAPPRTGELQRSVLDPGLAKALMGWQAAVTMDEGLALTARYFQLALKA